MKTWTIRRRIVGSFAALLAVMVGISVIAFVLLARIEAETSSLDARSHLGLRSGNQIARAHLLSYALLQAHVLETNGADKEERRSEFKEARTEVDRLIATYEASLVTAADRTMFDRMTAMWASYHALEDEVLKASSRQDGSHDVAALLGKLGPEFDRMRQALDALVENNRRQAGESRQEIMQAVSTAQIGIGVAVVIAFILALMCSYHLLRAITQPLAGLSRHLEQSGTQVSTSISEIASTARRQETMASEIASTTIDIGVTSKQISATSKELVRTLDEVSTVADQTANLASSGHTGLAQMEETMGQVMEAAGSVNAKLAVLSEKAANISQVVTTITKVADQTNLLSLNAAIEAEKAGEYGRGFSVVANEIRRLADQTAVATYDIEQMVKEIQSAVSSGVMGMDKFSEEVRRGMQDIRSVGGHLSQIIQQVLALPPRVESVNEGMRAQTTGAEQITEALNQLSNAAQQTVESLRQSNMAIEELHHVSKELSNDVSRFQLRVA